EVVSLIIYGEVDRHFFLNIFSSTVLSPLCGCLNANWGSTRGATERQKNSSNPNQLSSEGATHLVSNNKVFDP
ncbi:MAG: hypothetical protein ACQEQ0_09980, partial [Bacteroidota bacterium]